MKNTKPFRLKDPKTGLYYTPSREIRVRHPDNKFTVYVKSNLSKKGKFYLVDYRKKIGSFYDHTEIFWSEPSWNNYRTAKPMLRPAQEWEIEYL